MWNILYLLKVMEFLLLLVKYYLEILVDMKARFEDIIYIQCKYHRLLLCLCCMSWKDLYDWYQMMWYSSWSLLMGDTRLLLGENCFSKYFFLKIYIYFSLLCITSQKLEEIAIYTQHNSNFVEKVNKNQNTIWLYLFVTRIFAYIYVCVCVCVVSQKSPCI